MHTREEQLKAFDRLLTVMDELREKCPWDRKQTFDSLRQNTIEETYELATAIVKQDMNEIAKELGDVLLHVVFYAKLGSEDKWNFSDSAPQEPHDRFDIADVCNRLCDKLIFRHPHVYGPEAAQNAEEVSRLWEQVKLKEKGGNKTVLEGIPDSLPTLVKAYRIQDKAANAGFDWEKKEDVWEKVKEEIAELEQAMRSMPDNPTPPLKGGRGDSNTQPTYTFTAKTTDYTSRFKLVFSTNDASTGSASDAPFAYISNGEIRLLVETCQGASLQVIDMTGRVIRVCTDVARNVSTDGMTAGVYVLRLIDCDSVRMQKIVVP